MPHNFPHVQQHQYKTIHRMQRYLHLDVSCSSTYNSNKKREYYKNDHQWKNGKIVTHLGNGIVYNFAYSQKWV